MPLADEALQNVLRMILKGEHYRKAVLSEISDDFFRFTVRFFKDVATAKINGMEIPKTGTRGTSWTTVILQKKP